MRLLHNKAIFLDRDGTLNKEKSYLYKKEDWEWLDEAIESLVELKKNGYLLIVITNQSGIARGYYTSDDVIKLHEFVNTLLYEYGIKIDAFYICPHHPLFSGYCDCRKPAPGLILKAANDFNIDLSKSWMIGDKISDVNAGKNAGCNTLLVLTGYGEREKNKIENKSIIVNNLKIAVDNILKKNY